MTDRLTEQELAALEALEQKATPGPWTVKTGHELYSRGYKGHYEIAEACEENHAADRALIAMLPRLLAELRALREERDELQATLDLEWKANRRGIEMWQAATGKTMSWPDQAELVAFVLKERDEARARLKDLERGNQ